MSHDDDRVLQRTNRRNLNLNHVVLAECEIVWRHDTCTCEENGAVRELLRSTQERRKLVKGSLDVADLRFPREHLLPISMDRAADGPPAHF